MHGAWHSETIAGKNADIYEPATQPRFGIIHLHGYQRETLRDRPAFTKLFADLRLACVCPHGQRSWWVDRICQEFDPDLTPERYVLEHVVPFFRERWNLAPRGLGLQGISMGGQGALRLAFKYPELFPVVAAIAPALDFHDRYGEGTTLDAMYESKEQCRQDTALLHIHPSKQPPHIFYCIDPDDVRWYRGCDRLHEKLSALGVPHEFDFATRAGGHAWDYFDYMAQRVVRFIYAGLEYESRRLL